MAEHGLLTECISNDWFNNNNVSAHPIQKKKKSPISFANDLIYFKIIHYSDCHYCIQYCKAGDRTWRKKCIILRVKLIHLYTKKRENSIYKLCLIRIIGKQLSVEI